MKLKRLLLLLFVLWIGRYNLSAQDEIRLRPTYINFNYGLQKVKSTKTDLLSIKYDYAAAFTAGRTYFVHKKPILNMIHIGIDWSYIDLNFAGYTENLDNYYWDEWDDWYDDEEEDEKLRHFQLEAGMHVGPSITVTPIKDLRLNAYFRYAPSVTAMMSDYSESPTVNYGSFFVTGINLSYKIFSLGVESRWGTATYKFDMSGEDSYDWYEYTEKIKMKTSGTRIYLGLRF